jgi:hypothetical protein
VVRRRDDSLLADVLVEVVDVRSPALDLRVLLLVDVEDVDVDALARVREPRLDLLGDEEVVEVRPPVEKREAAVDRVVIGVPWRGDRPPRDGYRSRGCSRVGST